MVLGKSALGSGFSSAVLQSNGTFTLDQTSSDAALLALTDAGGQPLLLGFSGSAATGLVGEVSPIQTAVALVFYALGAFTLPGAAQEQVRVLLAQDSQVQALGEQVATKLGANPLALAQSDSALIGAVVALRDAILGTTRQVSVCQTSRTRQAIAPTQILVNPANEVNGLLAAPNADGLGLTVTNSRRRNALLYIYGTAYTDADGIRHTPNNHKVAAGDIIFATSGTAGVIGSLVDVATGTVAYAPVTSNPYSLGLFPNDAAQTEYRIDLIGNGNGSDPQSVFAGDPAYVAAYTKISFITFAKDLLLPAIATLVGFQSSLAKDVTSGPIADASTNLIESFDDLAGIVSGVVDAGVAISQTSARSTVIAVIKALANSGPLRQNFINWLTRYAADHGFAFTGQLGGALATSLNAIVSIVDKVLGTADLGAVLTDWGRSDSFTRFDAKVIAPKVKISPPTATIGVGDTLILTVSAVAAADASNLTYHWGIIGGSGSLRNTTSGLIGTAIDSSTSTIEYRSNDFAEDGDQVTVQVEAFLGGINDPNRRSIGTSTTTIKIADKKVVVAGRFFVYEVDYDDDQGNHRASVQAAIGIPKLPNALAYSVRAYNFNDTAYFGTHLETSWREPNPPSYVVNRNENPGEYVWGISGGNGPVEGAAGSIQYYTTRFAGMKVEVTVTLKPDVPT